MTTPYDQAAIAFSAKMERMIAPPFCTRSALDLAFIVVVRDYRGEYFLCLYFLSGTTPAYRPSGPMHTHQGDDECDKNYNTFRVLDGLRSHKLIRLFDRTTDKTQFLWFGHFDAEQKNRMINLVHLIDSAVVRSPVHLMKATFEKS